MKAARYMYFGLSVLFAISVLVQIYWAGMAVFADGSYWRTHTTFVHLMELIPLLMIMTGFMCRSPRVALGYGAGLFVLVLVMFFTANIRPLVPWAAALHPVMAALIFVVSILAVWKSSRWLRHQEKQEGGDDR